MIKKFTLGAVDWKVKIDNKRLDDLRIMGLCEFPKSLISIHDDIESRDLIDQTLYHEVIHAILDSIGEHELSDNEDFVQKFAILLHQFEATKK
jgi:hypothetical protein